MAFKKSSQKKKQKSKKKSPADREWSHEGGQQLDASIGSDPNKPKGRRRTQERDERQRRGRSKIEMRKEKQAFARKMSQKISFNQILGLDEKEKEEPETRKKRRIEPNPMKSTSQVYKKIKRFFVDPNLQSTESGSDVDEEEDEDELEESQFGDEDSVGDAGMVRAGVILKDIDENDEPEAIVPPSGVSNWFFSSNDEDNLPSDKSISIKANDLELSSTLTASISGKIHPKTSPFPIAKVGDIPELHTMWGHLYRNEFSSPIQSTLLSYLSCYADMFIEGRDEHTDEDITNGTLWHILGHIVNSRISVMKHDKYLKKQKAIEKLEGKLNPKDKKFLKKKKQDNVEEKESELNVPEGDATVGALHKGLTEGEDEDDVVIDGGIELNIDDISNEEQEVNVQDSGYTRPRVLILCPFRSTALEIVTSMKEIFNVSNGSADGSHEVDRTTIKNWDKFQSEYSLGEDDEAPPDNQHKPSDWQSIFKDNLDDEFKMGIQVNPLSGKGNGKAKGVHMRLFTDFYHSDIILASPLGLRLILENSASTSSGSGSNENKKGTKVENDYLSSLEIIYFHQADVLLMQNWSHVEYILQHCNQLPHNKTHASASIDFTRIRPYFLDNLSKQHRQIILSSHFHDPNFNSLIRQECQSKSGIVKLKKNSLNGCLSSIITQVKQIFNIVPVTSFLNEEQERFQYFNSNVLTPLLRLKQSHTLIVTPSYLHFVQVRNELIRREANVAFISEYSRESEISRGRSQFFHGTKEIMLYSGRAHFFRRFRLRGARHLIFYSLPEYAHFYPEIVNFLGAKNANEECSVDNQITSCIVLCTRYEKMALERIVGTKRCEHMLSSGKATFMFF